LIWLKKKEISSKNFETGKIAGSDQKYSGLKREKSLFLLFFWINLKTKNVTIKTISKLVNASGNVITDQNQI
jgi:hypothetical protein